MGCWLRGSPRRRISICTIEETNVIVAAVIAATSTLDHPLYFSTWLLSLACGE